MLGFVGILSRNPASNFASATKEMADCLARDSFYSGTYLNPKLGLWAGWACSQGSVSECAPVWNQTKDVCLIFSGQNFSGLGPVADHSFPPLSTSGDEAAGLIVLYEQLGLEFLEKLNGWFSGLLLDLRESKVVLFNDRYGLQRIYYHENQAGLFFSSEAKALLKVLPALRRLDLPGLGEFISCGCVLQNRTLFCGISLLPGASRWIFSPDKAISKEIYFQRTAWENQPVLSEAQFYEKLKETFTRILPRYFRGREQIGMSLTGGVDARMVMAWSKSPPHTLPCYTFGGSYRDCIDVRLARRVARECQQSHQIIPLGQEFLSAFPALAEQTVYLSDGTMDVTGAAELYVNRIARHIAPVRLTGNYGSEILRRNVAFHPDSPKEGVFEPGLERLTDAAASTYAEEFRCHPLSFIAFKQVPWHHYSRFSIERSQLSPRSPYLDNELVGLAYQAPLGRGVTSRLSLRLVHDGNPALSRIPTDRGLLYRPIPFLTKSQHMYQEFTAKAEYAYDYGMPHWLARLDRCSAPLHLEKLFLGRHKFCHFRIWYRDKLNQYLREVLLDPKSRTRPYLQGKGLEGIVNSHMCGFRNYTTQLTQLLTIELIQRQLVES